MLNLRKYFPEGEEGDISFCCWLYGISREQFDKNQADFETTKKELSIRIEEALAELETPKQQ